MTVEAAIAASRRIVGFTGAGISTDSGIPDYRSAGGLWERFTPVYFNEFLQSEEKRLLYWRRKIELWPSVRDANPNSGHEFFVRLLREKKLSGVITQNIDGLHEKSGLPADLIVNLHGTALEVICLTCGAVTPSQDLHGSIDLEQGAPVCDECGGLLKPNTISFGQNLDPAALNRAYALTDSCDLLIAMGSTLVVYPASEIPARAKRRGAKLAIVTLSETPHDAIADFVVNEPIADFVRRCGSYLIERQTSL